MIQDEQKSARTLHSDVFAGLKGPNRPSGARIGRNPPGYAAWSLLNRDRDQPRTFGHHRPEHRAHMLCEPLSGRMDAIEGRNPVHRPPRKRLHCGLERAFQGVKIEEEVLPIQPWSGQDGGHPPIVAMEFLHDPPHRDLVSGGELMIDLDLEHGCDTTEPGGMRPILDTPAPLTSPFEVIRKDSRAPV